MSRLTAFVRAFLGALRAALRGNTSYCSPTVVHPNKNKADEGAEFPGWTSSANALHHPAASNERLGFLDGVNTVIGAFAWLLTTPRIWFYALVPVTVFVLLCGCALYFSLTWVQPWVASFFADAVSALARVAAATVPWIAAVFAGLMGITFAWLLTPPVCSPALEKIVREREQSLGALPRANLNFLAELACGLRAQATVVLVVLPLLTALWLIDWLLPIAVFATFPIKILATVLGLAWSLLDYPLTLRGMGMRERWALISANPLPVLGFGGAFLLLFWVPLSSIVLLPVGAAASAELSLRMLRLERTANKSTLT